MRFVVNFWLTLGLQLVILIAVAIELWLTFQNTRVFQKRADKFGRELLESVLMDEELMEELLDRIVKVVQNCFASTRGVAARDQKGLDRRLVAGIIDQNPLASKFLEELGIKSYLEKKPQLVFYLLSQYPQILSWFAPKEDNSVGQTFANSPEIGKIFKPPNQ